MISSRHAVRLVFTLAFFVLYHAALQVKLLLVQHAQQMAHAVALGKQRVVQHGCGHVFKIVCAIVVGGAVQVGGANALHGVDVGIVEVFAAAEHQVLKQVSEAGLARLLILRSHVVPGIHRHNGGLVVFVYQHRQAIFEHELCVLNIGNGNVDRACRGMRRRALLRRGLWLGDEGEGSGCYHYQRQRQARDCMHELASQRCLHIDHRARAGPETTSQGTTWPGKK